ncbi:MAG TPA: DnaB-like helicase C-terminal domain-containing protein, partial [Beijerinckiaceae bacterium]
MTISVQVPSCLGVEQAVLGSILLTGETYGRVADILDPDDFGEELHRRIFDIAGKLARDGRAPTVVLVRPHLGDHDIGGVSVGQYLASLCSAAATPMGLEQLARTIKEFADLRRLIELTRATAQTAAAAAPGVKASRLAADLISEADRIALRDVPNSLRRTTLSEAGRAAYAEAAERRAGKPSRGVPTGLPELDDMIGALERGQGSILAGRPSMGKTAIAVQVGVNVARSRAGVYMVSLEMGATPLAQRVLSLVTAENGKHVPYARMAKGHISQRDEEAIEEASRQVDPLPFIIEQQPGLTASQIMAKARQVKQQFAAQGIV